MKSDHANVEALTRAVLREARGDADQVLTEARQKSEAIRQRAQADAAALRTGILEKAEREARRIQGELVSAAQLQARTLELEQREKLLDEVFEAVRKQLTTFQQESDYATTAQRLLKEALTALGAKEVKVHADAGTRKVLTEKVLTAIAQETGVDVHMGKPLTGVTGLIVETADGHRQFDNTCEARLLRMREALRAPVYHLLMGEPL